MLLNAVVLAWFSFFALGLSTHIGNLVIKAIQDQGGMAGPTINVVVESLKYCVVMVLMAIVCFQAPSLAAALTGGAIVQQGVQIVQNALMVSGLRARDTVAHGVRAGGLAGPWRHYVAGHAAGTAGRAMAGRASTAVRTAAYRLAALRGRT